MINKKNTPLVLGSSLCLLGFVSIFMIPSSDLAVRLGGVCAIGSIIFNGYYFGTLILKTPARK